MKKLFTILFCLTFLFIAKPAFALNDYSVDLEKDSTQYLTISDASQTGLDTTGDMTIEFWFKQESIGVGVENYLITKYAVGDIAYAFKTVGRAGPTQDYWFTISDDGSSTETYEWNGKPDTTGTWTHIAMYFDASASTAELFINGTSQGTDTGAKTSIHDSDAPFNIGSWNDGGTTLYDGRMDDVRIWNDVRTADEIANFRAVEIDATTSSLVGYWKLENNANDATSNGNDLTETNSPTYSTHVGYDDENSYSVDLEAGSSQYFNIADNAKLSITGDMTIEAWIKPESTAALGGILSKQLNTDNNRSWDSYLNTDGKINFWYTDDGTSAPVSCCTYGSSNATVPIGRWSHIAFTVDASAATIKAYINGKDVGFTHTYQNATSIYDGTADVAVGARLEGASGHFDGLIDDVRLWNDIRTAAEINASSTSFLSGDENHLIGYWKFENNANDTSTSTHNLTENNTPTYVNEVGAIPFYELAAAAAPAILKRVAPIFFGF